MRVLLVEKEADTANFIKFGLESEYFVVDTTSDGATGYFLAKTNNYDIVVLSYALPGMKGSDICTKIRQVDDKTPIIFILDQPETETTVALLNSGADDCLTKPLSFCELLARIKAILRRPKITPTEILEIDNLVLHMNEFVVRRGSQNIHLTRKEFMLLEMLLKSKGTIVSKDRILDQVWDVNRERSFGTLGLHILSIRKKICYFGDPDPIKVVPGIGYGIF